MVVQVHQLVEAADVVREGWNGYNVFHDTASRVGAMDVGFLPSARAGTAPPAKFVYLLGSDDYKEEDIPQGAFVVYQVSTGSRVLTCFCCGLHCCFCMLPQSAFVRVVTRAVTAPWA